MSSHTPPPAFVCPLTQVVMVDPVIDPEGHSYERSAIEDWLGHNPTSPVTRNPLTAAMLAPNRALGTAIEEWQSQRESTIHPEGDLVNSQRESTIHPEGDLVNGSLPNKSPQTVGSDEAPRCTLIHMGDAKILLETDRDTPLGTDLCLVIDVSASMATRTSTSTPTREETNLSVLDVVRHAAKALVTSMGPDDRLALVTFASEVHTLLGFTPMDTGGKAVAFAALDTMRPTTSTNLWGGVDTGLALFDSLAPTGYRNAALFVLTDGMPNVRPPRGEVAMVQARSRTTPVPVHTFGFGYGLDSRLLVDMALAGHGSYSFIPDAGMVGTVFVHAWANLKATVFHSVKANGQELGDVRVGTQRHFILKEVTPRLCLGAWVGTRHVAFESAFPPIAPLSMADNRHAFDLYQARTALYNCLVQAPARLTPAFNKQVHDLRSVFEEIPAYKPVVDDLNDQVAQALSREDWYVRWGRHYLPSLAMAHRDQRCNNFKDPGVAAYGQGVVWTTLRDQADEAYLALKTPAGSLPPPTQGTYASHGVSSMATYHDPNGTCVTGDTPITLAGGDVLQAGHVKIGTLVETPSGPKTIVAIVKTACTDNKADVVCFEDVPGGITPWHPVHCATNCATTKSGWVFPTNVPGGTRSMVHTTHVYSFVLDEGGYALRWGDWWFASMGALKGNHAANDTLSTDSVFYHPFFSTPKAIEALVAFPKDEAGRTLLPPNPCTRDPATGLVNGFHSPNACF